MAPRQIGVIRNVLEDYCVVCMCLTDFDEEWKRYSNYIIWNENYIVEIQNSNDEMEYESLDSI